MDELEKALIKRFKKNIFSKFIKAIKEYELIDDDDKIAVCMSGGKDSFVMAKCFQEIKRHKKRKFEVVFMVMDPGYKKENRELIIRNCENNNIPVHIFNTPIFQIVDSQEKGAPCYLCARMRRGYLYSEAKELGCNKIALGHHFDDVIETILLSVIYSSEVKTMMPKLKSTNFGNMELIRPMYLIRESDIIDFRDFNKLDFLNCACTFTEKSEEHEDLSKRREIKELIKSLKQKNKYIDMNIFRSVENVNIDAIIGYKKGTEKYNFLDNY